MATENNYLHGYSETEQQRLYNQARFLEHTLFSNIDFSDATHVLEVGCGVGAQSEIMMRRYPHLQLTGIELSDHQLKTARHFLGKQQFAENRFELLEMDATDMTFPSTANFDAAYLCWVLEHIPNPERALSEVRRVLKRGSQVVVSEVLNSTLFLEPYCPNVLKYWMQYNDWQYESGGDPFIGAKLGNVLQSLGYVNIQTEIKSFHYDSRMPAKRAMMLEFWTDLLLSGAESLLTSEQIDQETIDAMKKELRTVQKDPNAVFFYSFVQARAYTS